MEHVDVMIFVEHVARELDVACLLSHLLRQDHHLSVAVASYCHDLPETLRRYRARVIAVPYCYSRQDAGMRQVWLAWRDFKVVNLAFEQLFSAGNKPFKKPRDAMARTEVLHFASGELFAAYLESHQVGASHIARVGSLACGTYREPYRPYFQQSRSAMAEQLGLDEQRPWIFFPENFGAAFFSEREIARRIRQGMDATSLQEYCNNTRRALVELATWCQRAAKETDAEIILRPRPATPQKLLADSVASALGESLAPRLRIIKHRSVREWILACDHTVSNYSTSLVEAAAAGKPASMLCPWPLPASMHCDWHGYAAQVTTCEEFLQLARNPQADSSSLPWWAEQHLLGHGDPFANAAEAIASVVRNDWRLPHVTPPGLGRRAAQWLHRPYRAFKSRRRALKHAARNGGIDFFENDFFDSAAVHSRIAAWRAVLADSPRCQGAGAAPCQAAGS